jgi:hypothetical protein
MKTMKTTLTLIFFLLLINLNHSSAQDNSYVPIKNGAICYENVVKLDNSPTKLELYNRAKRWAAMYFPATPSYIPVQLEDKENGTIIINIFLRGNSSFDPIFCYGMVQVVNGKYKYSFGNFSSYYDFVENGKTIKSKISLNYLVDPSIKLDKTQISALQDIDYLMKQIIQTLINTMAEPDFI